MNLSRREFLAGTGAGVLSAALVGQPFAQFTGLHGIPRKILFLMTDQHRPDGLGLFGDPYAKTPALDQLARDGTAFRQTYSQYPLCVPARTSIILGRYPHSVSSGIWGNKIRNPQATSFLELLRGAGWKTACFGKLHIHQRSAKDWSRLDEVKKWKSLEKIKGGKHLEPYRVSQSPQLKPKIVPELPYGAPSPFRKEAHQEWRAKEAAIEYMKAHREENWFIQCSFVKPHPPLNPPEEYWREFDRLSYKLPDYPEDDLADAHPTVAGKMTEWGIGAPTKKQIRDAMIGYYACLNFCDDMFGEVLAALDELGLRDETLVVYTSDHGEMLWDHRLWHKNVFFDQAVRVPFIARMPGMIPAGRQSRALVEHIDFFPTFCELAGIATPDYAQGKSLFPVLTGRRDDHKDRVYSEAYYWGEPGGKVAMIFDGRYKLVDNGDNVPCELYDLEADPQEMTNVSQQPKHAERAEKMLTDLRKWRKRDPGPGDPNASLVASGAWLGAVVKPLDGDESPYLVDAGNLSKNSLKGDAEKWHRVLTVPSGSFAPNSVYEMTLDWESKGLKGDAEFFYTFMADKDDKKNRQSEFWKDGKASPLSIILKTNDSDKWSLAVGIKGQGHLAVKRIRIEKK